MLREARRACAAIVGRPNVGKSTLFNRLVGRRRALVHDLPGVTRDRLEDEVHWRGRRFPLIDTGGIGADEADALNVAVSDQALVAARDAAVILFVVDARQGPSAIDEEIGRRLRREARGEVLVVANKAEGKVADSVEPEFARLGLGPVYAVSAENGDGTAELLDRVLEILGQDVPVENETKAADDAIEVALVGRPNVGKSMLFNRVLGQPRAVVSERPGTTRDAVDVEVQRGDLKLRFVDTAGLRSRGKSDSGPERLSAVMTVKRIQRAHVVLVLMDALEGVTHQDAVVAGLAVEAGKAVVLVFNKWDLVTLPRERRTELQAQAADRLKFLAWAPRLYVSARSGSGVSRLLNTIAAVDEAHRRRVPTGELNRLMSRRLATLDLKPRHGQGGARVLYLTQSGTRPPRFALHTNRAVSPHFSTLRQVENVMREAFPLVGTPIKVVFKTS